MSSGTGGTIAGCSRYLKEVNPNIKIFLADPKGSGLFNFIKTGEKEDTIIHNYATSMFNKDNGTSIAEGIGIARTTGNFK